MSACCKDNRFFNEPSMIPAAPPRLLLVEDDPVSRSFMSEALGALPALVDSAQDIAEALEQAHSHSHALFLIDAHLPDGDGGDCLRGLRRFRDAPALAVTAGASRAELDGLQAAGFLEVLPKPVSIALLQATVRRLLGQQLELAPEPDAGKLPVWDEARALAAIGGNPVALQALRKLFLDELPGLSQQLSAAQRAGDSQSVHAVLHKLKASCGFVGAARMARAVDALSHSPMDEAELRRFDFAAADALEWRDAQA
jgi:CheY-like chemotaxis protein/HPt (histidine-containing phosphotransfer) domain-containing protein